MARGLKKEFAMGRRDDIVLWRCDDQVCCIASKQAREWELRVVRRADVIRRAMFRCFVRAFRVADAWRMEFGGSRV